MTSFTTASPIFKRSFPDPEPITGDIYGFVHDPSVIRRDDGTYFLFTTNNKTNIASAPSMSGPWTHLGPVLPNGSIIDLPGKDDLWAPDIAKIGDTYYLYYSVSDWGAQNASDIGVATSTALEPGSWTDHGSIGAIMMQVRVEHLDIGGTINNGLGVGAGNIQTRFMVVPGFNACNHQIIDTAKRVCIELVITSTAVYAIPRTIMHLQVLQADVADGAGLTAGLDAHRTQAENMHDGPHILV